MANVTTQEFTGSDASGVDAATNRVITLSNTTLTSQIGFIVYVSGLSLALTSEYTVNHLAASTTITFLNKLWDDMAILVQYPFETNLTQEFETDRTDFQSIINDNGESLTLLRQTRTGDAMGDVTDVAEESFIIVTMIQDVTKKDRQIQEMGLAIPGNSKAFFYHSYPNSITGNGTLVVQVGDIIVKDSKRWRVVQMLGERVKDSEEIFKSAVIKKLDLDEK